LLTNFPESSAKIFVFVKGSRKLVALIENTHDTQELRRRYGIVDVVIPQEIIRGLYEQELQYTFDDDLFENLATFSERSTSIRF